MSRPHDRSPARSLGPSLIGLLAAFLAAFLLSNLAARPAQATSEEDWRLDKQQDGVEVHTRPVPGSGIRAFRGVTEMPFPADDILRLLRDADRFSSWFPNCPESKLLGRRDEISYQYSVMDSPWPVSDRDNVWRSELRREAESGRIVIDLSAAPDHHPEQEGRVRVREAHGAWQLDPTPDGGTRVTFRMHLEPGGGVPDWLINTRVVETPFQALVNLRRALGAK